MINRNYFPNAADDNSASPDDAAYLDSLIDSKRKYKIDPRSTIKLKKIKNTVNNVDDAYNNASHNAMDTVLHTPNAFATPDAENKTSMIQLLDGQEYPVARGDIFK